MQRFLMACALSFIGSLISLELGSLWWIGLIGGFVAGYIGYDVRTAAVAISSAFAEACKAINVPDGRTHLVFHAFGAGASVTMTTCICIFGGFHFLFGGANPFLCASYYYFTAALSLIGGFLCIIGDKGTDIEFFSKIIKFAHPIPFFCWTLPRGIIWIIARVPTAVAIGYRFFKPFVISTFRYVHSNARLLFGIDVAIGVAVGHYTGSALLGGLAGGMWWIIDWHLISVKVMGLKTA